ncbi:MAG: tetratricopeptide repeat protein, partial [Nitrosopumilaceae archaeon]|nr:tetratricopeptide repeat protein [Nitrosopumilaceae archaeon]
NLSKAIEINSNNYTSYIFLGQVASSGHDFNKTLKYAKKAIEIDDSQAPAYGIMGDAYIELGKYDKAKKAYERMIEIKPSLYSFSRLSHIKDITGDTEGAIMDMKKSIRYGFRHRLPKENMAWAEVILGSLYFNKGDLKNAEIHYLKSLSHLNNYYLALEHLAEINAVRGDYEKAIKIYSLVLELNPNPDFHAAIAEVYDKMGNKEKAEEHLMIAKDKYESYLESGYFGYLEHHAGFYADNEIKLNKALELAKKDLQMKQDIYTYDTLAWIYHKLGDNSKAMQYSKKSLEHGTKDAGIFYHAGMINYSAGNLSDAIKYFDLCLKTNPYFDMSSPDEVRNLIRQIEKSNAV